MQKFIDKPGGLLFFAGNFLTQFYFSPLSGSLIISVLILLIFKIFEKIAVVLNSGDRFSFLFGLLPACLLLLMQTRYDFQASHLLGFFIVAAWFLFSVISSNKYRPLIVLISIPVLYYLTGAFVIVYLGLTIVYYLLYSTGKFRYLMPASLVIVGFGVFFVFKDLLFLQPLKMLLGYPLFLNDTSRLTFFLALFSSLIILLPLFTKVSGSVLNDKKPGWNIPLIAMVTILPLTILILYKNFDPVTDGVMKFEKLVFKQDWDNIIRQHEKSQSDNIVEQYYYNLALSEKGQLCNRMFFGRQSYASLSLSLSRDDEQSYRSMYFYYTVGLTCEAHHLAYEQMVQHGYRPENIKMLIKTELINGNFRIAERYINVLKKTLHYRQWAVIYERMLFNPEMVKSDPELGRKMRLLPAEDFLIVTEDFRNLETMLKSNPGNRIAFEYKLARILLEKDLMEVGAEVKKFKGLGYEHFPRHIEEAIVSLVNVTKEFPDLGGLTISRETDQRFIKYFSDLKPFRGDRKLAEKGIKKAERNTFWYYLQFGLVKSDYSKRGPVDNSVY